MRCLFLLQIFIQVLQEVGIMFLVTDSHIIILHISLGVHR